jgi:hypothetical protein
MQECVMNGPLISNPTQKLQEGPKENYRPGPADESMCDLSLTK